MKLYFIMGNVSITLDKKYYNITIASSVIMKKYPYYYKPIATYGIKRK